MSKTLRSLVVGALALCAVTAMAATASATSITTAGGTYTATTNTLQTLNGTVIIPITLECMQTITLVVLRGTYTAGQQIGYVTRAVFACLRSHTVVSLINVINRPLTGATDWPITLPAGFTAARALLNIGGVAIRVDNICLYTGTVRYYRRP
jgi:amino acid transporter